jgi:hypothetical protein
MLFTSEVGEPSVNAVRVEEQPFELAKYMACVRLSTHTLIPSGSDVEAVAIPPANVAPSKNAAITFVEVLVTSTSFIVKNKLSLEPERKFKNYLLIGATYDRTTQPLLIVTLTVGNGFVAGPVTTAPFLNGSKLAL